MQLTKESPSKRGNDMASDGDSSIPAPSNPNEFKEGNFYYVEIDLIVPDPKQSRKYFNYQSLEQLSQSITQRGMLHPVIIKKGPNGEFLLAAGERRLRAAKLASMTKVPAFLVSGNAREISLIENLQRENLRPLEEAEALASVMKESGFTLEQLSQVLNKAKSTLSETMSLNRLPDEIKEELWRTDNYPRRLLVEIAKQESSEKMISIFKQVRDNNFKSEQVREISRSAKNGTSTQKHNIRREISELAGHLKTIDRQEVASLEEGLKELKSLIGMLIPDKTRAEPA